MRSRKSSQSAMQPQRGECISTLSQREVSPWSVPRHILRDYLRRYWWGGILILVAPLDAMVEDFTFYGFLVMLGPCLLLMQQRTGVTRVWRTLPAPRRGEILVEWLGAVVLWPLLYFLATLISGLLLAPLGLGMFVPAGELHNLLVACGWSGLMTLLACTHTPFMVAPQGFRENLLAMLFGALWGLSIAGAMFLINTRFARAGSHSMEPYLIMAAPVLIVASLAGLLAVDMHAKRERRPKFRDMAPSPSSLQRRLPRGLALVWALLNEMAVAALVTLLMAGMVLLVTLLWPGGPKEMMAHLPDMRYFLFIMPVMLMMKWLPAMGALRGLPMRRRKLGIALTLLPLFLITGAYTGTLLLLTIPVFRLDTTYLPHITVLTWGIILLAFACTMRFGAWVIFATLTVVFASPTWSRALPIVGTGAILFGVVAIMCGAWAIQHLLGQYPLLYRRRYDLGMTRVPGTR